MDLRENKLVRGICGVQLKYRKKFRLDADVLFE